VSPAQLRAAAEAALPGPAPGLSHPAGESASDRLRLTGRVKAALALAEEEARTFTRKYVGVGDLLIALVRQRDTGAHDVLQTLGVNVDAARAALRQHYESVPETS